EEHHELLAMVAQEMWHSSVDNLRNDVVGVVADVFAELKQRPPAIARQIRERLTQHSLLVKSTAAGGGLAFDHDDFRVFYLGEAVGAALSRGNVNDLRPLLSPGSLPSSAVDEAVLYMRRHQVSVVNTVSALRLLAQGESAASFVRDNVGALAISTLDGFD